MDPTNPPNVSPTRPLPQAQVLPPLPTDAAKSTTAAGAANSGPGGEGATIDELPGDAAVQLSFWQHPFVQNVMPLVTSVVLHATLIVLAITLIKVVPAVTKAIMKEQVTIPDATMNDGAEGGIPHPGLGGDPNRDAAQDKFMDVPKETGINDKPGKDLAATLSGGGSGDSGDSVIGVAINGAGMGSGKGAGAGQGSGTGGGTGDGGALAPFGVPGGGGGIGPRSTFVGVSGNAKKIVYVLDATGSMMSSFDALRVQLRTAISNLRPPQSFDIVFINDKSPPPLSPALLFTTPENKRKAMEYVDTMAPRGGTDPLPAITKAFELQPEMIFLLIDPSDFPDKQAVISLVAKQNAKAKIKLNIIAFEGHDVENEKFLKELATQSGGIYKYISSKELAE
jgi:hypothetical protein